MVEQNLNFTVNYYIYFEIFVRLYSAEYKVGTDQIIQHPFAQQFGKSEGKRSCLLMVYQEIDILLAKAITCAGYLGVDVTPSVAGWV